MRNNSKTNEYFLLKILFWYRKTKSFDLGIRKKCLVSIAESLKAQDYDDEKEIIIRLAKDKDKDVRFAAQTIIDNINKSLIDELNPLKDWLLEWSTCGRVGVWDNAIDALVKNPNDCYSEVRLKSATVLLEKEWKPNEIDIRKKCLVKIKVAKNMKSIDSDYEKEILYSLSEDKDKNVRFASQTALENLKKQKNL